MSSSSRPVVAAGPRVHRVASRPEQPGRSGWARSSVAAERQGDYAAADSADPGPSLPTDPGPSLPTEPATAAGAAFGLPVLAELPRLASVLERLQAADEAMLAAVAELADLLATDEVERVTGVGIDHWLAVVAAQTRMDRRLLVRTCRLLHRLPTLERAVRTARLSFPQLRGIALALRNAPTAIDDELDAFLGSLLGGLERLEHPDPDVLVRQLRDAVDELDPVDLAERERDATTGRYLTIQPFLDGTGGRFDGAFDAAGLALLDAASTPPAALGDHPDGHGAARADTLLARLAGDAVPATDPDQGGSDGAAAASGAVGEPTSADVPWWDRLAAPTVLLRLPFDTLLDDRVPADLLTGLVGGRLRLTSAAARRLLDERGARLRAVVVDDDGSVLGVGRSTRQPPGWLRDVLAAMHDTCTGPGCDRPAHGAHVDHAAPWWPTRPGDRRGTTDLDNLGPLCPATNRAKEVAGWRVTQRAAGVRTWHHPRSGLITTTVPATWRSPNDPRHPRRRDGSGRRHPSGPAAPGPDGPGPPHPGCDVTPGPPPSAASDQYPFPF